MNQTVTHHVVGEHDKSIEIEAIGPVGVGGAYANYEIRTKIGVVGSIDKLVHPVGQTKINVIKFQEGTIPEKGINGITMETLMAICIHRLECFQAGPYPCEENAVALRNLQAAMKSLHGRTLKRIAKGTEGTLQK